MAVLSQAFRLALVLTRVPAMAASMQQQPLPADVLTLIRIAGGCDETCRSIATQTRMAPAQISEVAVFYLQQMLLFRDADSYRILGVSPDASPEQLREHMRWLMRWLHPDRTQDEWNSVFAQRVLRAWDDVKSSERRSRYDARLARETKTDGKGRRKRQNGRLQGRGLPWIATPILPAAGAVNRFSAGLAFITSRLLDLAKKISPVKRRNGKKRGAVRSARPVASGFRRRSRRSAFDEGSWDRPPG